MEMMRYGLVALMAMGAFLAWVALRVNAEEVEDDNEPLVDVPDQPPEPDPSEPRPGETKKTFKPPDLTEEEKDEIFLPQSMKCDGCQAIAIQWSKMFHKAHLHKKKSFRLGEGAVIETIERACEAATYDVYGITTMESGKFTGVNRLKGPGVATDVYGVTQMGGRTPHRLAEACKMYLGELEEWDVYERWLADARDPKIQIPLKKYLCLEETKHCVGKGDYFGDFKKVPEEDSFGSFIEKGKSEL